MENLGPLFVAPHEPDRLGLMVAVLAAVLIAVGLAALVRGRLPDALSYSGLLLLPLFAYVLGDLHLLEASKRVEFCGSCHEPMSPVRQSLTSNGDTLAAIHYQRGAVPHDAACYRCHSGYGVWGGTRAKLAGLRHMIHTVRGDYTFPLSADGRFDIHACLDCHAQAVPFRSAEPHRDPDLQQALLSGEMGCVGVCHPDAHPSEALNGIAAWEASR